MSFVVFKVAEVPQLFNTDYIIHIESHYPPGGTVMTLGRMEMYSDNEMGSDLNRRLVSMNSTYTTVYLDNTFDEVCMILGAVA